MALKTESVHRQFAGLDNAFLTASGTVKSDLGHVMHGGDFYATPEVCREMKHIESGIDHIRLDHDFLRSSREWGNQWSPESVNMSKQGAIVAMDRATGTLQDIKNNMNARRIQSLQENQVRNSHQKSVTQLRGVERNMGPYAHESIDRIKQFCDHIGVTDRYTGYRNNLNRGTRDPVKLGYSWLDNQNKNPFNNSLNVGWKPGSTVPSRHSYSGPAMRGSLSAPASRPHGQVDVNANPNMTHTTRSIQEQCGINTNFPGHTEYMDRYVHPPKDQATPAYIVNPLPDYGIHGRPLGQPKFERMGTEYQTRYEWPDGNKIVKLPWLRE
ncbi:hypothetical protein LSH36_347g00009 [Paralvinella palmiformis]|uniref:Uncharacterized protein n=1 Tax=Paralvinella palmiformis TaxID=53620 RepID=A0AAD9JES9_9ANNE|nr:hypothetical protein LSH36_347g00009 [Paralvinella palmiformis]